MRICRRLACKKVIVPVLNLLERICVIVPGCASVVVLWFKLLILTRLLEYHHSQ